MNKIIIQYIIGISILMVLYVPNKNIVDRDATQWLFLSIINLLALFYNLFLSIKKQLIKFKLPLSLKIFSFLFIWAVISLLYSNFIQVTIIDVSRFFLYFITFFNLLVVFNQTRISFKTLSIVFTFLFAFEIYFSFKALLRILSEVPFDNSMAGLIKGLASNKNITSFSIALKVPFLIYLYYKYENKILKTFFLTLLVLAFLILYYLDTRAITLANYLVFLILFLFIIIKNDFKIFLNTTILIIAIFLSYNAPNFLNNSSTNTNQVLINSINGDQSTNQRLRFYNSGLNQILNNPIVGVGFGNWKLESIKYDKQFAKEYIVPYHMHNDFLQFGAELGIIGLLLYLMFALNIIIKYFFYILKKIIKPNYKILAVMIFFTYFLADSNLNFPFARPMIYLQFLVMISFLEINLNKVLK